MKSPANGAPPLAPRVQRAQSTHAEPRHTRRPSRHRSIPLSPSQKALALLLDNKNARVLGFGSAMAAHVASSEVVRSQPSSGGGILARVDRLDIMLGYLEELRGSHSSRSTSAAASGDAGAVTTSEVSISSVDSSPRSTDRRRCRPIGAVVVETQVKGNLMDRVEYLEKRLLKASYYRKRGKGLQRLVASCVKGDLETHYLYNLPLLLWDPKNCVELMFLKNTRVFFSSKHLACHNPSLGLDFVSMDHYAVYNAVSA
ncbi:hypothetical protein ZIOFF_048163 [Zingiber officinale]|uniref:Uncharacterized protein n=1 Tax=Zingiber officinale TaxID=94328 RepID=A0A8J5KM44_ZINOF|nr:hypothetical protein ZIOFF_048163 [Zingiber officinale]